MLNHIIKFALGNRLVVLLASVLLLIGGSYTAVKMEVDVFPDLTAPTVAIITEAHGLAPEEVEQLVSFPIESTVNGSTDVRRVRSSASAGISIVWVEFDWGTDIYRARQIVAEKLATLSGKFPQGVSLPVLAPNTSIMGEIMLISITAKQTNLMELRSIADWNIRPVLLATGGVSQVVVIGGDYKQYQILAKPALLKAYGITMNELFKATNAIGQNVSGGLINQYGNEYLVKGILRSNKPEDIGNTLIKTINGKAVKIADVATVTIGAAVKLGDGSLNARPSVIMTVMKQPNTNTLELTEKIDHTIEELKGSLPKDVVVNTKIFRQASFIEASIGNIEKTLIEGSIFVVIILSIFLMNWRATAISLIAIPISLLVAIVVLKLMGLTINTMSLGGMAIAIGDLVDDAIIDVENVLKRLKENAHLPAEQQENKFTVIYNASTEIRSSIIHATFIIIIAFTPLFFLTGMEGRLLVPLGIAFVVALFASLIVAITLTPVLCSYLLTSDKTLLKQEKESWLVRHLNHGYLGALQKAIIYRKWLVAAVVGLFIGALFLFSSFGRSFLPEFNEGSLVISAVTMPGISLEESNKIGQQVERAMLSIPEVKTTTRRTGRAELDEHAQGVNASEIDVPFFLEERSRSEFMTDVRQKLAGITGANITIGQPIGHRIDHMLSGTRANIAIKIFGQDLAELYRLGNETKKAIENIPGLVDISVEQQIQIPQIQIKPKRDLLAAKGISLEDFSRFVEVSIGGEKVGDVYEAGKRFDLVLRYEESARSKIEDLKNLLVDAGDGSKVPLGSVAEIVSTKGPNTINRENAQRKLVVSANVAGRDQLSAVEEIQAKMKGIKLPQNYRVEYGGQFEAEAEASRTLVLSSVFALLAIFLVLYHEFKDSALSMIILINLPLALIGGIVSVWLTGSIISIPVIIGFITLFGIATRNGILLVSHYRHLQQEKGFYDLDIVIKGSIDRLSPILMTALTAGLALIPLAMASDQPGNEIQSPMANVILGGLLSSTLLNLFIVPIVYNSLIKKENLKTLIKHKMKTLTYALLLILGLNQAKAQTLDSVLNLTKSQNKTLKVHQAETDASKMAFRTGLNPENPTAEYEILFGTPKDAGNQQDFAITQRFDFPSSYTYRKQASNEKIKQADFIAKAKGQELLLNVKLDWLQWVYLNQLNLSYTERVKSVEKLHTAYQKKMSAGDGNVLDLNKVKLLLLETNTQLKRNEQQREQLKQKFVAYTGGSLVAVDTKVYPANPSVPSFEILDSLIEAGDPLLKIYATQQVIAAKETALNKALTLPGFEAGYHSQSILGQKYQGIHVGLSVPLWEKKNTVKQKKLEQLVAENRMTDHRLEHMQENRVYYQQYEEATYLLGEYKGLLDQLKSEPLLEKALQFGEISVIQYYNEILSLYKTRDAYLEYGLQQQQAIAKLYRFML